jgi:hypothetical protein
MQTWIKILDSKPFGTALIGVLTAWITYLIVGVDWNVLVAPLAVMAAYWAAFRAQEHPWLAPRPPISMPILRRRVSCDARGSATTRIRQSAPRRTAAYARPRRR